MKYTESEQLALPIECPDCGDNKIVGCLCDWKMVNLSIPVKRSPFRAIEKFLGMNKKPHDFKRIEVAPGVRAIQYKV